MPFVGWWLWLGGGYVVVGGVCGGSLPGKLPPIFYLGGLVNGRMVVVVA